jgi:hypothetical protein
MTAPMNYYRAERHAEDIEGCHERLNRVGWSIGEVGVSSW